MNLHAGGSAELTVIEKEIRSVIDDSKWEIYRGPESLTLITKDVTFLNTKAAALSNPNDDIWQKYSYKSDYKITISVGEKIGDKEYLKLVELQKEWSNGKDLPKPIHVPKFHLGTVAVYVSSPDQLLKVRPSSVETTYEKVMKTLEKTCQAYEQKPQQHGAE